MTGVAKQSTLKAALNVVRRIRRAATKIDEADPIDYDYAKGYRDACDDIRDALRRA